MANKPIFDISEKVLLTKLHAVALDSANIPSQNECVLLNSGLAVDGTISGISSAECQKIAQKDASKIKFFSNKNNVYEAGIAVLADRIKKSIPSFNAVKTDKLKPEELYEEIVDQFGAEETDKLRKDMHVFIVRYMSAFCGKEYADSISESKIVCMAFPSLDSVLKSKNGVLGECDKEYNSASVILYKIGYTIGEKQ